ncbi:hypothetical protein ACFFHM_13805 [Halalkalibacter kiskunsagensis]|uniref:Uncharacterized protein n=1 Tax=Halalkalibacter kiskunsagensis TaxID=1548599 RepID=A0ABV6KHQ3_9BACI
MMTQEVLLVKEFFSNEVKNHYYVVWELVETVTDELEDTITEEVVKVMYETSECSSLIPMHSFIVEKAGNIEDSLTRVREQCKYIFKENKTMVE